MIGSDPIEQDLAILAPVPRPILESAVEDDKDLVAFGSDKADFWMTLPEGRFRVLIYESFREDLLLGASWEAVFEFWRDTTVASRDPKLSAARPTASLSDWEGFERDEWAIWWFCSDLRRLDQPILLQTLRNTKGKAFSPAYIPRGPELITAP